MRLVLVFFPTVSLVSLVLIAKSTVLGSKSPTTDENDPLHIPHNYKAFEEVLPWC